MYIPSGRYCQDSPLSRAPSNGQNRYVQRKIMWKVRRRICSGELAFQGIRHNLLARLDYRLMAVSLIETLNSVQTCRGESTNVVNPGDLINVREIPEVVSRGTT